MKHSPPTSKFSTRFKEYIVLRRVFTTILILGVSLIASQGAHATEMFTLVSGNGVAPGLDSIVKFDATGPMVGPYPAGPLPFAAANGGASAFNLGTTVATGNNPLWKGQLAGSTAQWVGTAATAGAPPGTGAMTALYSQAFTFASATVPGATLDFSFLTDNDLGDAGRVGVYINGLAVPGTSLLGSLPGYYGADQSFATKDITALLAPGVTNYLQVYTVNTNGPSGVQWDAKITIVPEPTSFALFGLAMVGFARRRR